jgi:hypothetical protein
MFFFLAVLESVACAPAISVYSIEVGQLTVVGASFYNASHLSFSLYICLSFPDI